MKYRIYIDEVGNSDIGSSDDPNHRFLSITGIIIDLDLVKTVIHTQMEELKNEFFESHPDDPIIFHRKEIMNCKPPFECLKDPKVRKRFDARLLELLTNWDYTV